MPSGRALRLLTLGLGHLCVDAYAVVWVPMMVYFAARHRLSQEQASLIPSLSAVATSSLQPLMAWLSDRGLPRSIALSGPALAGVALALSIMSSDLWAAMFWLVISGLGVAVYHPEAAVLAGDSLPRHRSLATGLFLFTGTVGLAAGPGIIPWVNQTYGPANSWLVALPAVVALIALWAAFGQSHTRELSAPKPVGLLEAFHGQVVTISLLVGLNTLRAFSTFGVCLGLSWLAVAQGGDEVLAGRFVLAFVFSGGVGGLFCGYVARRRTEKPLLVLTMLAALPTIWLIPLLAGWHLWAMLVVAGILANATIPVTIAMSQQMVPAGARLASSLQMGASWGLGSVLAGLAVGAIQQTELTFAVMALAMLPAAACAALVPRRRQDDSPKS